MKRNVIKHSHLIEELSSLLDLQSNLNAVLTAVMYTLSRLLNCERSSIFLSDPSKGELYSFSSLDLDKREICIPAASGVAGWVFRHCQPAVVEDAYDDSRFDDRVDRITHFRTRELICVPLTDHSRACCLGTLQSLNKKNGNFISKDLEVLRQAACLVAVAIQNKTSFDELKTANNVKGKVIKHLVSQIDSFVDRVDKIMRLESARFEMWPFPALPSL